MDDNDPRVPTLVRQTKAEISLAAQIKHGGNTFYGNPKLF